MYATQGDPKDVLRQRLEVKLMAAGGTKPAKPGYSRMHNRHNRTLPLPKKPK